MSHGSIFEAALILLKSFFITQGLKSPSMYFKFLPVPTNKKRGIHETLSAMEPLKYSHTIFFS